MSCCKDALWEWRTNIPCANLQLPSGDMDTLQEWTGVPGRAASCAKDGIIIWSSFWALKTVVLGNFVKADPNKKWRIGIKNITIGWQATNNRFIIRKKILFIIRFLVDFNFKKLKLEHTSRFSNRRIAQKEIGAHQILAGQERRQLGPTGEKCCLYLSFLKNPQGLFMEARKKS